MSMLCRMCEHPQPPTPIIVQTPSPPPMVYQPNLRIEKKQNCTIMVSHSWIKCRSLKICITHGGENHSLTRRLILKTAMLTALAYGSRCSELVSIDTKRKEKLPVGRKFQLTKRKKNRKTAIMPGNIYIPKLNKERLCVVKCLDHYIGLHRTREVRTE